MVSERYTRNMPTLSEEEQEQLSKKKVLVVGCGGLGGFVTEYLVRLGIGDITVIDGDVFDVTNLNRQLLSSTDRIGYPKALAAKERAALVNPEVKLTAVQAFLTEENAEDYVRGKDLVIDALDNVHARLQLEDAAAKCGVTIIHGAVQGLNVQVIIAPPGKGLLHSLYRSAKPDEEFSPKRKSCLVMAPACCAALEVSQALLLLLGKDSDIEGSFIMLDMRDMSVTEVPVDVIGQS